MGGHRRGRLRSRKGGSKCHMQGCGRSRSLARSGAGELHRVQPTGQRKAEQRVHWGTSGSREGYSWPVTGMDRGPQIQKATRSRDIRSGWGVRWRAEELNSEVLCHCPAARGRGMVGGPDAAQPAQSCHLEGAAVHLAPPGACCCHSRELKLALRALATGCLATWLLNTEPATHVHSHPRTLHTRTVTLTHAHMSRYTRAHTHRPFPHWRQAHPPPLPT